MKKLVIAGLITTLSLANVVEDVVGNKDCENNLEKTITGEVTVNNIAEGRYILAPEPFEFPAYANIVFYKPGDTIALYFQTDHMGVVHYKLPVDNDTKNQPTNYLVFATPGNSPDSDKFKAFTTIMEVKKDDDLREIKPNSDVGHYIENAKMDVKIESLLKL